MPSIEPTTAAMPHLGRSRRGPDVRLGHPIAELRKVFKAWVDPYRPELHYMRGPGPKWHQKHDGDGPTG